LIDDSKLSTLRKLAAAMGIPMAEFFPAEKKSRSKKQIQGDVPMAKVKVNSAKLRNAANKVVSALEALEQAKYELALLIYEDGNHDTEAFYAALREASAKYGAKISTSKMYATLTLQEISMRKNR
jgi:hypothetical protein